MRTLVGWWKGEDNLVDSVGGNDAVIITTYGSGDIAYTDGVVGRAFDISNLVTRQLRIPYNASQALTGTNTWELEFIFKYVGDGNLVHMYPTEDISDYIYISIDWLVEDVISLRLGGEGGERIDYTIPVSFVLGNWYKIRVKSTSGVWQFWIDDVELVPILTEFIWPVGDYEFYCQINSYDITKYYDEIKIYTDSIQPEYIMIKELECFLAKKQATYGAQGDDLTGDNYFPALPDSKVEIITAMTDIETVSATYDHDLAVRGFVNANAELSCYMRSLGDSVEPDYALLARASGWAVAGPTAGKYTITPIVSPTTATGDDLEVWHYLGGIGSNASVLTKVGNVVGNWKITGDVGKPVIFSLTGAKGIYVSQAAATMVTSVVKDRTLIPAALPVTVSINSVVYKLMKFSFEGGNTVEQYIDCAETYGFGDSEITKKKIKFAFTCYANAALANPLDAVIAGAVVADVSIIWGKALYKTKIVVDDPQFIDCKTVDVGGLTGWEVTGNATQNDITITQNDDHV